MTETETPSELPPSAAAGVDAVPETTAAAEASAIQLPDRLSVDPASPYFVAELLRLGSGVRFNGVEKHNVEEYCLSEGWIRVAAGKAIDRKGRPLTLKLKGTVEVWVKAPE